ncbi:MAG: hypothetical protein GY865_10700 [candidate division Zixibacteria bacterium]|nr:hypothetical protein [candidate division Zixibacteria bacterium]
MSGIRRKYKLFLLATVLMLAMVIFVRFSKTFDLQEISAFPDGIISESELMAAPIGKNMFGFSGNDFMDSIIADQMVIKAELDFGFPNEISIILNDIKPLALVRSNGKFYVLDELGYLSKFDNRPTSFNFPIITGAGKCRLFAPARNDRLHLLSDQLQQLRTENNDFYLAISSIDISSPEYTVIKIDGLKPNLKMYAGDLFRNMEYLRTFLLEFNPDLSQTKILDLRLTGQVIAVGK